MDAPLASETKPDIAPPPPDASMEAASGVQLSVDDRSTGSGAFQFKYSASGNWTWCDPCGAGSQLYKDTNTWSNVPGATATFAFNGTRIRLYGVIDPVHGIGGLSVDNGAETSVDFYSPQRLGNRLLWTSDVLPAGNHTLKIRLTNTHNPASTDIIVAIDRVDVE
jgi:hypothetical protein